MPSWFVVLLAVLYACDALVCCAKAQGWKPEGSPGGYAIGACLDTAILCGILYYLW